MTDTERSADQREKDRTQPRAAAKIAGAKLDHDQAAEIVKRVQSNQDEPFGAFQLVRSVVRARKQVSGC